MICHLSAETEGPPGGRDPGPLTTGLLAYALTSSVVLLGVVFGDQFIAPPTEAEAAPRPLWVRFASEDGGWYNMIATAGYHYDPSGRSPVAFFPLYPWLGAGVIKVTGLAPTWGLLLVTHVCLAAAFIVTAVYLRGRQPTVDRTATSLTLLALGLMPATLFFRMTYSESTCLLICLVFLLSIQRGWPWLAVALIGGLATATRPVGVGLLLPLLLYTWRCSPNRRAFLRRVALAVPIGCWGLLAYAAFLTVRFGDPVVFAKSQAHWGTPAPSLTDKVLALLSYQPIWGVFLRGPDAGWSIFTWELIDPTYYVTSIALIVFGAWRHWLNAYEVSLAGMFLIIPYVSRAYEMDMGSHARFAALVFPVYLVLGRGFAQLPLMVSVGLLGMSAFFLGAFAALFAKGYPVF